MAEGFTAADLGRVLAEAGRAQLKGVLRDQRRLAGIGNAYSDEILHAARLSPFKPADGLDGDGVADLFGRLREVLGQAIDAASGVPIDKLKDAKRSGMRVHGRAGSRATSVAPPSRRFRSPTRRFSTARVARPAGSRWPTVGCRSC
nr:hypothetical protein [Tessaracoccus coleopterorum]